MHNNQAGTANGVSEVGKRPLPLAANGPSLPRGVLDRSGHPLPAGARLTSSLRLPRDLTLSSSAGSGIGLKKTFTPNLAAAKRTPKDARAYVPEASSSSQRGGRGSQRDRGRGSRGRGRGRGLQNVVQLQGAFEGGLPPALKQRGDSSGYRAGGGGGEGSGGAQALERPKYIPAVKEDKDAEQAKLDRLLKDDFIDDADDERGILYPLMVPLMAAKGDVVNPKVDIKKETKKQRLRIKQEPQSDDDDANKMAVNGDASGDADIKDAADLKAAIKKEKGLSGALEALSIRDVLGGEGERWYVLQMPQWFPLHGVVSNEPRPKASTSSAPTASTSAPKIPSCQLRDLPEGRLGTLKLYKSGKARLFLDKADSTSTETAIEMEVAAADAFFQDAAVLDAASNCLTSIGTIQAKMIARPQMLNRDCNSESTALVPVNNGDPGR